MSAKEPRQIIVVGIDNGDEVKAVSPNALRESLQALENVIIQNGVAPEHVRRVDDVALTARVDELSSDEYLRILQSISADANELVVPGSEDVRLHVRVGAMNEEASRSLVSDATMNLLAFMRHNDYQVAFLTGDDLSIWRQHQVSDIAFLSHKQFKFVDPLTGLLTYDRFLELVEYARQNPQAFGSDARLLYVDIDDFKSYNRAFGHAEGNELLLFVANQLKQAFSSDVTAHLSLDHFAVLTSLPDFLSRCSKVHAAVKSFSRTFAPELKFGIFKAFESVESSYEALDLAKFACVSVKGRYDTFCGYCDAAVKDRLLMQRHVARHAEQAVNEHWVRTYAQPVMDGTTGALCGFEALARWHDPEHGVLPPAVFISTLEDARLIQTVDMFMVDEVCHYLHQRILDGEPVVPASVNISRIDFTTCDVLELITASCDRWGVPHSLVAVEVTEGAMDGTTKLRTEMSRLRSAGFEVWMDDFGSGYSSLNLLKDYEFDVLKVDMAFLHDMEKNRRSRTIVNSILNMARDLGVRTLVEGVETPAHLAFLREVGCDMMQGYLFGKPQPLKDGVLLQG